LDVSFFALTSSSFIANATPVWNNVYGFNYTPMQKVALAEPLVDIVELKAVVTKPCLAYTIDLYTVKVEDLAFSVPFQLEVERNDYIHAFISWFDIDFSACHKPLKFSTGPHAKYTHWKQTVFYISDYLICNKGETIRGQLSSKPTVQNPRDLDVRLEYQFEAQDPKRSKGEVLTYRMC
jgi:protein arginine N-methyltransferase 1